LTRKKVRKLRILKGVDPNILATGGATTGYATTSKPLPRNNPGDLSSLHFSSTILFEEKIMLLICENSKIPEKATLHQDISYNIIF
jgi:hypothetical protein